MPEYYSDYNNVLGEKPRGQAPPKRQVNVLLALLFTALPLLAAVALAVLQPGGGVSTARLRAAVAYIVVEFGDGHMEAGSGWVCGAEGQIMTSMHVAYPRGVEDPPVRWTVYVNSGREDQQDWAATVAQTGGSAGGEGTPADQMLRDWAVLKANAEGGTPQYLTADLDAQGVDNDVPILICGYNPDSQTVELNTSPDIVRNAVREGQGLKRFSYGAQPKGMDGGPVVDRRTGKVIGMNIANAQFDGDATTSWALPAYLIEPLTQMSSPSR